MACVLDTNVCMTAKNLFDGFDSCLAFWDTSGAGEEAGGVFIIEIVADGKSMLPDDVLRHEQARFVLGVDS